MGRMAVEAAGFVESGSVVHRGGLRFLHDVVVALVAELLPLGGQHERVGAAVGVVTLGATVFHRAVDVFRLLDEFGDLIVTVPTEFCAFRE
jgi:hypothetical protein